MVLFPTLFHFFIDFWNKDEKWIKNIIEVGSERLKLELQTKSPQLIEEAKRKREDPKPKFIKKLMPNLIFYCTSETIILKGLQENFKTFNSFLVE